MTRILRRLSAVGISRFVRWASESAAGPTTRIFIRSLGLIVALTICLPQATAETKPNVLFLAVDVRGWNEFFLRNQSQREGGWPLDSWSQGTPVFDAYTAYNMFQNSKVREGESALAYMRREAMPVYRAWSEKTVFCPGILPRYHDFRGNKPLAGTTEQYISMIRDMRKLHSKPVGDGVNQIYLITSFNEWWEGSTIEPTAEYGSSFLDATHKAFSR